MAFMNCPRCGLSTELRGGQVIWETCPRCLGRVGVSVPIYVTRQPIGVGVYEPDGPANAGEHFRSEGDRGGSVARR